MSSEKKSKKSSKKKSASEKEPKPSTPTQQPSPPQQEVRQNVPSVPDDFDIRMKFSFLKAIQQILLRANAKVHWDPEDLIPAGMLMRDIDNIIKNLEKEQIMIQVQNQLKNNEEKTIDEVDEEDEESEEIN